ncbi:MAG: MarR family transcriptional regulator [Bacilli bacterium]|nr:MarR family transcriptional regulator [Bacilli bacterium]
MQNSSIMVDLNEVNMSIFKAISARYKELGLDVTPVHSRIIMFLYDCDIPICQKDIERFVSCNKSTMSAVLNTMEKNELIVRSDSLEDSRMKIIKLTDKSKKIADVLRKDKEKIDELLSLDISDEEYAEFNRILNKIRKNIERI